MMKEFDDDSFAVPLVYEGDGKFMAASSYWQGVCAERYEKFSRHVFQQFRERSYKSHRHFFASIAEAWSNLPEDMALQFPSPTHLRKYALISCGYYDQRSFIAASAAEALRLAKFLDGGDSEYKQISVVGPAIVERRPMSVSMQVMGHEKFQKMKDDVMGFCWNLVGVDPDEAAGEVGSHA